MAFGTVGEIVNDAAMELGLSGARDGAGSMLTPYSSVDPLVVQLLALLKSAGRSMVRERNWTYLRGEHTFTTVAGQAAYDYPSGFLNMIDQTGWVRSTRLPMGGPLSPQEWQYLKARLVGVTLTLLFRPMNRQMFIFPDTNTPGDLQVAFEYQSGNWVIPEGSAATFPTLDAPTGDNDVVWFDSFLMSRRLKLEFLKAKGFDTTSALQDYRHAFELVANDDTQAPILSLAKKSPGILMGERNVPVTGMGS